LDAPAFTIAQLAATAAATALFGWFADDLPTVARPLSGEDEPQSAAMPVVRKS